MKKLMITALLLALSTQSQLARAWDTDGLLNQIRIYIGDNNNNDLLSKLDQLQSQLTTLNADTPNNEARAARNPNASVNAGGKASGSTDAANRATAGKNAAPSVGVKQANIQNFVQDGTSAATVRQTAKAAMAKSILDPSNPSVLDENGNPLKDASNNPIPAPVGGLNVNVSKCGGAGKFATKECAEDEAHLANKDPNLWKDEASKKQLAQIDLRAQEQAHKNNIITCKSKFEKLAAGDDPDLETCNGLGIDAVTIASLRAKALPKYTNFNNSVNNTTSHLARVDAKNNELILAQHQQRIIRLVLAERAATDKSCDILDTKDLSILEPGDIPTLKALTTAASITSFASASGTYSSKYCACAKYDAKLHQCKESRDVNFVSKKVNAEVTALDCQIDALTNKCKTIMIDGRSVIVKAVNAKEKAEAMDIAIDIATAAMTPADKAAYKAAYKADYIKKTSSIAFY